jgi:phage tail sheath gpL-like
MASDPRYGGFNHAGISYKHQAALTATYQVFTLTADTTNCARTAVVPPFALLKNTNFELDTIAGGASKVTYYLARDAAGDIPVTMVYTADVVFGLTTATKGTAIACIDLDYHYQGLAAEVIGTLYLVVKLNAGTANGNIRQHWRG